MSATDRLNTGRRVSGLRAVAESLYRRFTNTRGTVADAPTFGYDLSGYLGAVGGALAAAALPAIVEAEALKDDRIQGALCTTELSRDGAAETLTVTVAVTLADESGTFELTLGVTDVDVTLIGGLP